MEPELEPQPQPQPLDEVDCWAPQRHPRPATTRPYIRPALGSITLLAATSSLPAGWRFLCYCLAALPAVPRRPFGGGWRTPSFQPAGGLTHEGALRAAGVACVAAAANVFFAVERGADGELDGDDIWAAIDADRDGELSPDEAAALGVGVTGAGLALGLAFSVVSSGVLVWRLRSMRAAHAEHRRQLDRSNSAHRREEQAEAAALQSVASIRASALKRTQSGVQASQQIAALEQELEAIRQEAEAASPKVSKAEAEAEAAAAAQRAAQLQERLRSARAEKAALRTAAEAEKEERERAEVALRRARGRLSQTKGKLEQAQQEAERVEAERAEATAALEDEAAVQILRCLPPAWRLFGWSKPEAGAEPDGDVHVFVDLSNVTRLPPGPPEHRLSEAGLVTLLERGREARMGARVVVGSVEREENKQRVLDAWHAAGASWKVALELRQVGQGETFVDEKLHASILNCVMREELQRGPARMRDEEAEGDGPTLILVSGDGNQNDGGSSFPECCAYALELGWRVEVWSWAEKTSSAFKRLRRRREYASAMKLVRLDDFAATLVDAGR